MTRIVSVHAYVLAPGVDGARLEQAFREAAARGLFQLPGLVEYRLARGIKGARRGSYAAIWVYENRAAWERLWGPPDRPRAAAEYPASWRAWEQEVLAPLLAEDPDRIAYTTYEEVASGPPANDSPARSDHDA